MTELKRELSSLLKWYALAAMLWTAIVLGSLYWNVLTEQEHIFSEVITEARTHLNKDKAFRLWGASHGGVYVEIDENTPPNINLSHLPERDLTTPSGRQLTLMNPAYMLHQMMDEYDDLFGVKGKITSFPDKLFNPHNKPDAWELEALNTLEQGAAEVLERSTIRGEEYMRLMRPLFVKEDCLKCHAVQGYKIGDLKGAVGVSVPMAKYLKHQIETSRYLYGSFTLIWLIGLAGIVYNFRQVSKRLIERMRLVSKLKHVNAKLEKYSYQDGLTQVANRRMFDALLKREWASAIRNGYPLSLIMIDIDHFKDYNDGYGHQAGDICLNRIASTLNTVSKRSTDLFARYGGEEFVLLLPNIDEKQSLRLAKRCCREIEGLNMSHEYSEAADVVTVSVGVTTLRPAKGDQVSVFVEAADQALYRAKNGGRNHVESSW